MNEAIRVSACCGLPQELLGPSRVAPPNAVAFGELCESSQTYAPSTLAKAASPSHESMKWNEALRCSCSCGIGSSMCLLTSCPAVRQWPPRKKLPSPQCELGAPSPFHVQSPVFPASNRSAAMACQVLSCLLMASSSSKKDIGTHV